ncbi:MAG: FecR family protein [Patescibacteria group bacterium]|nr:FecR family protein [Patescibacteria group bacterium]
MKKARIIVFVLLGIAVILGLLGWWFWSLGSIATAEKPVLRLVVEQGNVFISNKGTAMEEPAKSGTEVFAGDVIRTGNGSRASIVATGRSDLRLSENTEVEIDDVNLSWSNDYIFRFKLKTGRVWSRVMRLLDLGSVYEGQTDNVVATVRGTAFAMQETGEETQLFVDHSAVGTPLHNGMGENVFTIGEWGNFDFEGRVMLRGDMSSSTWPERSWIDEERLADERFARAAQKILLETFGEDGAVAMDNWAYGLSRSSENFHLRFSGDECKDLTVRYMGRQMYGVYDLMKRGKSGLAFQFLADLEKEIVDKSNNGKCTDKVDFAEPVGKMLLILSDVTPENEMYKLKLRFEEIYVAIHAENSPEAYWARALALDARLDELERFGCRPDFLKPMENAMDAVEQGLARQDKDFESLPAGLEEDILVLLSNKTHVQHVRLERFMEKLDQCKFEDLNPNVDDLMATSTTSTDMEATTSTEDVVDDVDQNNTTNDASVLDNNLPPVTDIEPRPDLTEPSVLDLSRIQLYAQPNPINVGEASDLYVKGIKKDGNEIDVTGYASFEQIGNLGTISGTKYFSRESGSVTLVARVNDNGQEYSSQVSLKINSPMVLSYLEIIGGNYQVFQGTSRQLSVIAHYTNGEVRDVTSASTFSVSNSNIGIMRGSTFVAGANALGVVTVIAQYSEGGFTNQDEINFEVVANTGYITTP